MITLLDNPVWEALISKQIHFNQGNMFLKYFPVTVSPFVALQHWDESDLQELTHNIPTNRAFSVMMAKEKKLPAGFEIIFTTPLYQLFCPVLKSFNDTNIAFRKLGEADIAQMLELTEKTKPGPFYERTIDFGNYIGIFDNAELVAMAGERLKLNGYTEVSAICTNPNWLGKGYASFLLSKISEQIIEEGNIPFLHVKSDNIRALEVYKRAGFQIRTDVYFAIFKKTVC